MRFRSSTSAIAAAAIAMVMMTGTVQAAEAAKYPDWKGAWTRWFPPGSVLEPNGGFTAGGQPSHDQTKPWGRRQEAAIYSGLILPGREQARTAASPRSCQPI